MQFLPIHIYKPIKIVILMNQLLKGLISSIVMGSNLQKIKQIDHSHFKLIIKEFPFILKLKVNQIRTSG